MIVAIAIVARVAAADDDLARAHALQARLEYDQALAVVEGALGRGGADPARYVELERLAGELAGGLDHAQAAQDHFARALALRPDLALPDGTSPKLTEPFAAAKARTRPLAVKLAVAHGLVTVTADDALGMVAGIAVHVVTAGKHADVNEHALRVVIPEGAVVVEVAALDAHGNRLWVGAPPPVVIEKPPPASPGLFARWSTYGVLATASLAVTGVAAWRFRVAQDDWNRLGNAGGHTFTELRDVEARGRRWGLVANIGAGVTAALAAVAIVVRVRHTEVHAAPTAITVSRRF
jgi:hypothetical protein